MKICIISGTYNPGRCGISDYIKLILAGFEDREYSVEHVAIDKKTPFDLKKNLPNADFYSLQFAPYAFSKNGIINKSLLNLANLLCSKKTHINFHEIWIGAYPHAKLLEKFIGWRQKTKINDILNRINPNYITCSNSAALDRLNKSGIDANFLYLFGNIPYVQNQKESESKLLKIVIFGTPYVKFPYNLLGQKLNDLSKELKLPVQIRVIGRQRDIVGLNRIKEISLKFRFSIIELGELKTESISKELQLCDVGISTTPYDILGKSGATAAMLEHRLPVITYDDGDTPSEKLLIFEEYSDQVLLLNDQKLIDRLIALHQNKRKPFFDGVGHTVEEMIKMLN